MALEEIAGTRSPARIPIAATAGLAAAMGVGRFAYTPLLPIMTGQAGLSVSAGAIVATANYAGYLLGAAVLSIRPRWGASGSVVAWLAAVLIASEFAMIVVADTTVWALLRFAAGSASAGLFVACAQRISHAATGRPGPWAAGIGFSGVGLGIAITGVVVIVLDGHLGWRGLWLVLGCLTAVLVMPLVLSVRGRAEADNTVIPDPKPERSQRIPGWATVMTLYFLEGVGYIVIGTFLVAAVGTTAGASFGPVAWVVAGLAAAPATVVWSWVGHRVGPRTALAAALITQAIGAGIAAVGAGPVAALAAAALFGGTFMGITALAIGVGVQMRGPSAAGPLTAIFGLGQMLGPLVVTPVLGSAYTVAFEIAAVVVTGAAVLAAIVDLRHRRGRKPRSARAAASR